MKDTVRLPALPNRGVIRPRPIELDVSRAGPDDVYLDVRRDGKWTKIAYMSAVEARSFARFILAAVGEG